MSNPQVSGDGPPTPPAPEPAKPGKQDGNDIKWYDKRLLIPSLIIAPLLFVLFYNSAMRHKQPEGALFEGDPVISGGIYKCCNAGEMSNQSWTPGQVKSSRGKPYA